MIEQEFKRIARKLKALYEELEIQARQEGISVSSPEFDLIVEKAREALIIQEGFSVMEYEIAKDSYLEDRKNTRQIKAKNKDNQFAKVLEKVEMLKGEKGDDGKDGHTPTKEELTKLILPLIPEPVPGKNGKTPTKEELVSLILPLIPKVKDGKTPTAEEITKLIEPLLPRYDAEIGYIEDKVNTLEKKIPEPIDIEKLTNEYKSYFSENFKKNIDILGMPDFRKLAMGLQAQIDSKPAGGSNTQLQYNNNNSLGGISGVTHDNTASGTLDFEDITTPAAPADGKSRIYSTDFHGYSSLNMQDGGDLEIRLGRDNIIVVRNETGSTINKGTAVYINGANGNAPTIAKAKADSLTTLPCIGLTVEDITNNSFGRVINSGVLSTDTSAFSAGDTLYVSASTAGALTATKPGATSFPQVVGVVAVSGVGTGRINVLPGQVIRRIGIYREQWFPANAMTPRVTNGAEGYTEEYVTNDIMQEYFLFDSATEEAVQFSYRFPDNWDRGTIKAKFYWDIVTGGTPGNTLSWGIRAGALSDDDAIDAALGTEQTVSDTIIAVGDLHVTAATSAITVGGSPALNDMIVFQVVRKVSGTSTKDAKLLGVAIQYLESDGSPAAW